MRKQIMTMLAAGALLAAAAAPAQATPLDLSGFGVQESVTGSVTNTGGVIAFTENDTDAALYFFNDSFTVAADALALSLTTSSPQMATTPPTICNLISAWTASTMMSYGPPRREAPTMLSST